MLCSFGSLSKDKINIGADRENKVDVQNGNRGYSVMLCMRWSR